MQGIVNLSILEIVVVLLSASGACWVVYIFLTIVLDKIKSRNQLKDFEEYIKRHKHNKKHIYGKK